MKYIPSILLILTIFSLSSCKNNKDEDHPNWSNSQLLDIPHKIRNYQYSRGNLVPNYSFESGKLIHLDSIHYTYNISNWKKDIYNVEYIKITKDSLLKNIASQGNCAIKISKTKANEYKETGEGVMSDFIKVIPGMYNLYVDVKCENVKPFQKRFNKYINDAVDIQLLFFDNAKQPIVNPTLNPLIKQNINNSSKNFSFGRFNQIDSTGWITVKCVSDLYPYKESVVPDNAKFVKIYLGLKGTGTIWYDNVRFYYSKENLTPRERSQFYFDSLKTPLDLIVPAPKKAVYIDTFRYFRPDSGLFLEPFILIPNNKEKELEEAVNTLKKHLQEIFAKSKYKYDIRKIKSGTVIPNNYKNNALIISLGNTYIYNKIKSENGFLEVSDMQKGFAINYSNYLSGVLSINGFSDTEIYYGCHTALQLIKNFTLTASHILCFPDKENRIVYFKGNEITNNFSYSISKFGVNTVLKTGDKINNNYILTIPINNTDENHIHTNGNNIIFIENSKKPSLNNIAQITASHNLLLSKYLNTNKKVYFIPPYNNNEAIWNNEELSTYYFNNLVNHKNLHLLFYGAKNISEYLDGMQSYYFESKTGYKPIYIDNFQDAKTPSIKMNTYFQTNPEKIPMGSIFDPYDNNNLKNYSNEIILQINTTDIFSLLRIATYCDYTWNMDAYDPELSLFKILVNEYGKSAAKMLYIFNDSYCGLLSTINRVSKEGVNNRTSKSAENEIASLNISFEQIKKLIPEETELIDVMMVLKKMLIDKYVTVYEKAVVNKKIQEDSLYSSIFTPLNSN